MANKTFNSGDVLTASDLNSNMMQPGLTTTGTRIVAGQTAYTISSATAVIITITYGYTFSSLKSLVCTVESSSSHNLVCDHNGTPGVSSASERVFYSDGATNSRTGVVHWVAFGTP